MYSVMLWLLRYTELLLYLPSQFCRKIIYCNEYVQHANDFMLQLLQYTELLLNLPSQFTFFKLHTDNKLSKLFNYTLHL